MDVKEKRKQYYINNRDIIMERNKILSQVQSTSNLTLMHDWELILVLCSQQWQLWNRGHHITTMRFWTLQSQSEGSLAMSNDLMRTYFGKKGRVVDCTFGTPWRDNSFWSSSGRCSEEAKPLCDGRCIGCITAATHSARAAPMLDQCASCLDRQYCGTAARA